MCREYYVCNEYCNASLTLRWKSGAYVCPDGTVTEYNYCGC
ncbi:hypothetical protein [Marinicrinis lubricantis]|uniref:Uncharacterized protein n=1 Tax=Marinicrinis lubricantis TaxID=2086470 RepID=A0ABW1IQX6_9BACL